MTVQIVRVIDVLPQGLDGLIADAETEGVRNVGTIASGWAKGSARFNGRGEALFVAYVAGSLAGVGGLTPCPHLSGASRMRRFYVAPRFRGHGVGRAIAAAAMQEGLGISPTLTCNARATAAAGPFWEAMGFVPSCRRDHPRLPNCLKPSAFPTSSPWLHPWSSTAAPCSPGSPLPS